MSTPFSRREFIQTTSVTGLAAASIAQRGFGRAAANSRVNVLSIGTVGTIGSTDRKQVARHPAVEITGLCDVDQTALDKSAERHPDAFVCRDYREAFDRYGDRFDAVIVSTPDHTHAPIMLTAMANGKHVYGQKPLVQQLEEQQPE